MCILLYIYIYITHPLCPMAHPLHPIRSRFRNKHWDLRVGRCVSSWWPWFWSRSAFCVKMQILHCGYIFKNRSFWGTCIYNVLILPQRCVDYDDTVILFRMVSALGFRLLWDINICKLWCLALVGPGLGGACCSDVECHCFVFFANIIISALIHHDGLRLLLGWLLMSINCYRFRLS